MTKYIYEALSPTGQMISDEIVAQSVAEAIRELEERGWNVQSIRAIADAPPSVPSVDGSAFVGRLEAALAQRATLIPALEALADELSPRGAAHDVRELIVQLRGGATASDLIRHRSAASWLPLLVRGITSQSSGSGVLQLMSDAARESDSRSHQRRSLIYPLTIFGICLVLVAIILYAIVPTFTVMFRSFGLSLPPPTMVAISLSEQLREYPVRSLAALVLIVLAVGLFVRSWRRYALTTRFFGLYTAGNTANVSAMSRFTRTLADMLSLDAGLPEALQIAGRATQHYYFQTVAESLAADAAHNRPLKDSQFVHNLPGNVVHAMHAGPGGLPNVALLEELSLLYSDRARERFDWSSQLVGPIAMLAIGLMVGFLVIALFMPLVQLVTSLT